VAEEENVGDVGAVDEDDVEDDIRSSKASRSFRSAFDCFNA
jgi:hypothetical protein